MGDCRHRPPRRRAPPNLTPPPSPKTRFITFFCSVLHFLVSTVLFQSHHGSKKISTQFLLRSSEELPLVFHRCLRNQTGTRRELVSPFSYRPAVTVTLVYEKKTPKLRKTPQHSKEAAAKHLQPSTAAKQCI